MPVGVQCPISFSLCEFPAIGIDFGVLGLRPYWCPSPFPSASILGVFHSLLSAIGFQSCYFFTVDVSPSIRSTLHLLTFKGYHATRLRHFVYSSGGSDGGDRPPLTELK